MSAHSSYSDKNPAAAAAAATVNSAESSPRTSSVTPPAGSSTADNAGPSPLTVGTRFVKQYYQVLTSENPDEIIKFYQPSASVLSTGEGSQPSTAAVLSSAAIAKRFPDHRGGVRFELEHGAIDAQVTGGPGGGSISNSGILVVVTGQVIYSEHSSGEEADDDTDDETIRCQAFVHTFVLNAITSSQGKRSYYVHNDVLRFLSDNILTKSSKEVDAISMEEEAAAAVVSNGVPVKLNDDEIASGGGVEESKEAVLDDKTEADEEVAIAEEEAGFAEEQIVRTDLELAAPGASVLADNLAEVSNEEVLADEGKKNGKAAAKSGSWASLVARAPVPSVSAPATAAAPAPTAVAVKQVETATAPAPVGAPAPPTVAPSSKGKTGTTASAPSTHLPMHKRDPDCTLVIKNISFQATEPDVVGMFEPFAKQTDATIMSITVSAHKGIAFVDYSEAAPVLAAVELHKTDPLQLHGRVLDIYQKTLEQRNRKGGPGRSGFAGSGGGRQYRGGRGDRGGGGRSGRGGR